jgi:hypothetical protein
MIPASNNGRAHSGDRFDRSEFDRGILTVLPPALPARPTRCSCRRLATMATMSRIRLPEVAVPVATYTGWARANGEMTGVMRRAEDRLC